MGFICILYNICSRAVKAAESLFASWQTYFESSNCKFFQAYTATKCRRLVRYNYFMRLNGSLFLLRVIMIYQHKYSSHNAKGYLLAQTRLYMW